MVAVAHRGALGVVRGDVEGVCGMSGKRKVGIGCFALLFIGAVISLALAIMGTL